MADGNRLTQLPVESVSAPSNKARVTQEPVEVIFSPTLTKARVTQAIAEVVVADVVTALITQLPAEAVVQTYRKPLFYSTTPGALLDYLPYVWQSGEGGVFATKFDRANEPVLLDFALVPHDPSFVKLLRGHYICIDTVLYPYWFTGYITNDPDLEYLGKNASGNPVWGYKYQATSDEYLLNLKALGIIPPMTNTTQGTILKALVNILAPGIFDTSHIEDGQVIARYVVDPEKRFLDVVKEFAEGSGYRFWAKNHKLYFEQHDVTSSPLTIDGNSKHFTPARLSIRPSGDPIINDAIVLGDIEPQGYINEYFLGDGFSAKFPLISSVYGIDRSVLLDETFSGASFDGSKWSIYDPQSQYLILSNGYLNVVGGPDDDTYSIRIESANLLPLEGQLRLTHGEYDFVSASDGVVCALWTQSPNSSFTGCVYGIRCEKSGADTILKPIVNGSVDGTKSITVDYTKRYVIRTLFGSFDLFRKEQIYTYRKVSGYYGTYGGGNSADMANIQTWIAKIDPSDGSVESITVWLNSSISVGIDDVYALYVPAASNDLHCTVSNITISVPMQASLKVKPDGEETWETKLIGPNEIDAVDGQTPIATISQSGGKVDRSNNLGAPKYNPGDASLVFFKDSTKQESQIPQPRDLVHLSYRRAGAAVGRVQAPDSVTSEATRWGDDGVRSITRKDLNPLPRTSEECELAAGAIVQDNVYQHYEGSYTQYALSGMGHDYEFTKEPLSGMILKFQNLPAGDFPDIEAEEIHEVTTEMIVARSNTLFRHQVTFGRPNRLPRLLSSFAKQKDVFSPDDAASIPAAVDIADLGSGDVPNVVAPTLTGWTSTQLTFNTGQTPPSGGGFEVRYTDSGWGPNDGKNLITRTASQTFNVPRTSRGKICFVRAYDSSGKTSRYSAGLHIAFPLIPPAPTASIDTTDPANPVATVILPTVQQDVWGYEIRADDNQTVLKKADLSDAGFDLSYIMAGNTSRTPKVYVYVYNLLNEYSDAGEKQETITAPSITGLAMDEVDQSLKWTAPLSAVAYEVQVAKDSGFAQVTASGIVGGPRFGLPLEDVVQTRYYRVRAKDVLGWGDWDSTGSPHSYTSTGVFGFDGTNNVYSVPVPPTPQTDPTIPAQFEDIRRQLYDKAWWMYRQNRFGYY